MDELRHCRVCKWVKPTTDFYPRQCYECKECTKKRMKATRDAKIDYYREYDRKRAALPHRKELQKRTAQLPSMKKAHSRSNAKYHATHPKRKAAHHMLSNAIRDKKIERWPCMICGNKADGHHPDYDRPLDVVWLCRTHHVEAHQIARKAA